MCNVPVKCRWDDDAAPWRLAVSGRSHGRTLLSLFTIQTKVDQIGHQTCSLYADSTVVALSPIPSISSQPSTCRTVCLMRSHFRRLHGGVRPRVTIRNTCSRTQRTQTRQTNTVSAGTRRYIIMKTGYAVRAVKSASLDALADRFQKLNYHGYVNTVSFEHAFCSY